MAYNNPLSFNNYSSATTNGTQLGTTGYGLSTGKTMNPSMGSQSDPMNVNVASPTSGVGGDAQQSSGLFGDNFWTKDGGAGLALGGVQVLGNLWASFQANKMAKKQMKFAREQWDTNLENTTQTYNTALEDRIRGRYASGTRSDEYLQSEIDRHSL